MGRISQEEYEQEFGIFLGDGDAKEMREKWLKHALAIREMEIKLYWSRTTYFSAFISVIFAAYGYVHLSDRGNAPHLGVLICAAGLVFSWAWFLVNKGSKYWQENWENHVDMLEPVPLYKVVLQRTEPEDICDRHARFLAGPGAYSVSRINQYLSLCVIGIWTGLLAHEVIYVTAVGSVMRYGVGIAALIIVWAFEYYGKTSTAPKQISVANLRERTIEPLKKI